MAVETVHISNDKRGYHRLTKHDMGNVSLSLFIQESFTESKLSFQGTL